MTPTPAVRALTAAVVVLASLATGCEAIHANERPVCRYAGPTVLMAEAVPTASMIPCVRSLPVGWHFGSFRAGTDGTGFSLDSDVAGKGALLVDLSTRCTTSGFRPVASDEPSTRSFVLDAPTRSASTASRTQDRIYAFAGGCVRYVLTVPADRADLLQQQVRRGVSFIDRDALDRTMRRETGRGLDPEVEG
jgi:hypothetical protein